MRIFILSSFLWLFVLSSVIAQEATPYTDSLLRLVPQSHDTIKIKLYKEIASEYAGNNFAEAVKYGEKALQIAEKRGMPLNVGNLLDLLGSIYSHQGGYTKGLEYKLKALDIYKRIGNKRGLAQLNNNVGVLHFRNQSYQQALYHYQLALQVAVEIEDEPSESTYLLNIGEVYQKIHLWDKGIEYELKSLKISEKLGIGDNKAYGYGILGQIFKAQGKFEQAIEYQNKAIFIFNHLQDKVAEAEYLIRIAETYQAQRDTKNALHFAEKGLKVAEEVKVIEWVKEALHVMSDIYAVQGDTIAAYRYHKRYASLKDSIFNESMIKQLAQLQSLYKTSEQQARIDLLTKDKVIQDEEAQIRNIFLIVFIIGFVLITLLLWVVFRSNKRKKRDNALLQLQKNEIEDINKDINASILYAKRIQDAILPTEAQLQYHLPAHFILFQPRDIVSGDFYWFQEKDGLLFFAAIDCTGHGVPGAFMSMMGDALLNQIVLDKNLTHPDLILNEMHREIRKTLRQDDNENKDGMDLALVVIDSPQRVLEFAGAHCPLILIQNNTLEYIKGDRLSVGGFQPEKERIFQRKLFPHDVPTTFYIFSDVYQDPFGGENMRKFSIARFRDLLLKIHLEEPAAQKAHLLKEFTSWSEQGNEKQIDDVLVIGVKIA